MTSFFKRFIQSSALLALVTFASISAALGTGNHFAARYCERFARRRHRFGEHNLTKRSDRF